MIEADKSVEVARAEIKLTPKDVERFWSKVGKNQPSGCWIWLAAKFSESQVINIRAMHAVGESTLRQLAIEFRVTPQLIGCIIRRKIWKHV